MSTRSIFSIEEVYQSIKEEKNLTESHLGVPGNSKGCGGIIDIALMIPESVVLFVAPLGCARHVTTHSWQRDVANQGRLALRRFYETMKNDPAPMEGSKLFNVLYGSQFKFDKEAMPAEIDALTEKIMKEYKEGEKPERRKRILLTGCPSSGAPMKVVKAIEENGGNVVVYENCGGAKSVDRLIDEDAEDIYQAIAERYLAIGCSVMTPDTNRYELLERLLDEYQVEGVVEMTLQACHTYNIEAKSIEKRVKEKGLPYIHIETDYSQADVGQLDTRIAAFLEMI